jgi:hypothetical protein
MTALGLDDGSVPSGEATRLACSLNIRKTLGLLETKLTGKSSRGHIYAHLLGFEDGDLEETPKVTADDAYTSALVKMHATIFAMREKGQRQAATALELLVQRWQAYEPSPRVPSFLLARLMLLRVAM